MGEAERGGIVVAFGLEGYSVSERVVRGGLVRTMEERWMHEYMVECVHGDMLSMGGHGVGSWRLKGFWFWIILTITLLS